MLLVSTLPLMVIAAAAHRARERLPDHLSAGARRISGPARSQLLKFRSMRHDAEVDGKPTWAEVGDRARHALGRIIAARASTNCHS